MNLEGTIAAKGELEGNLSQRNGIDGKDGKDGENGYTPVRGVDYWTVADKAEIREYVDGEIVEQLSEKADIIVSSASGTVIPLSDSAEAKLKGLLVHGKSTQDGTPTPSAPIEIVNAGKYNEATGKYEIKTHLTGKNLFDTEKYLEIAFGVNLGCEVVEFDGRRCLHIPTKIHAPNETIFDGFISNTQYTLGFDVYTVSYENVKSSGNGFAFKYTDDSMKWILPISTSYDTGKWYHLKGTSESGKSILSLFPTNGAYCETYIDLDSIQLEMGTGESDYEPYRPVQTVTLSLSEPIRSLPDGTSDIVHVDKATKSAWVERKIIEYVFDGSADELWALAGTNTSGKYRFDCYSYRNICKGYADTAIPSNVYCNQFVAMSPDKNYTKNDSIALRHDGDIYIYEEEYSEKTLDEFRARLSANPITVIAELATPTTEELSAETASQLLELTSYYPNTVVYNDQGTDMDVEYVADTKNYIDNKFTELQAALLATGANV